MTKDFVLMTIEDQPIEIQPIPGLNQMQLNYEASIGGANAPEPGADKTSENVAASILNQGTLATKSDISAAEIADRTITSVKLALLTVSEDVIAAGAITENKLYTGAVTADKIAANTITAAKIAANTITANEIAASTITAAKMNVSQLSAISANLGSITSGTVTGALLQTSSSNNTGVKIGTVGSDTGIFVYGQTFKLLDTSGNLYGYIGGYGGYYNIATYNNRNMLLDAGSATVHFYSHAAPLNDGGKNLGYYNYRWGNCFTLNLTFENGYYLNKDGNALKLNGLNRLTMDGGTFRRVGFTFKDSASNNRYIEVLATADPV